MQFSRLLLLVASAATTLAMTINLDLDLSAVSHGLQHEKQPAAPLKISHVPGYFRQDDAATDDKKFDYVSALASHILNSRALFLWHNSGTLCRGRLVPWK